jgi:hypothetical protein
MDGHCDEFMEKGIHIFILSHDKQRYVLKQTTYQRSAARDLAWLHCISVKNQPPQYVCKRTVVSTLSIIGTVE